VAKLSRDKPAGKTLIKHMKQEVDEALDRVDKKRISDEDVHRARKGLKKARASLRLLKPTLKPADYRRIEEALRDAAKPLSAARDATVLPDTLRMLLKRHGLPERSLKLDKLKRQLARHHADVHRETLVASGGELAHSRGLLHRCRARIRDLDTERNADWKVVGAGLKRIYAQGRRRLADSRASSTPEAFHEWRKKIKYLRYSLEMFRPLWPAVIGAVADEAHELADCLGDEHDLTVLRETVLANRESCKDEKTVSALLALIDRRQRDLREKALSLGARLFEEKPGKFAARFKDSSQ
jgi:CHAD domain-containing protein